MISLLQLKLYDTAGLIGNPFAYDEHPSKMVREKIEKMSEWRIRTKKEASRSTRLWREKMLRDEEKAEGKSKRKQAAAMDVHMEAVEEDESSDDGDAAIPTILSDLQYINVFENLEFVIDESLRYPTLLPSAKPIKARLL